MNYFRTDNQLLMVLLLVCVIIFSASEAAFCVRTSNDVKICQQEEGDA